MLILEQYSGLRTFRIIMFSRSLSRIFFSVCVITCLWCIYVIMFAEVYSQTNRRVGTDSGNDQHVDIRDMLETTRDTRHTTSTPLEKIYNTTLRTGPLAELNVTLNQNATEVQHIAVETLPQCPYPRFYNGVSTCQLQLAVLKRTSPISGGLYLHKSLVTRWTLKAASLQVLLIHITPNCSVNFSHTYDVGQVAIEDSRRLLASLPKASYIAGVTGIKNLTGLLVELGLSSYTLLPREQTLLQRFSARHRLYVFLARVGYQGVLKIKSSHLPRSFSLTDRMYFGNPFDYNLSPTSLSEVLSRHLDLDPGGLWSPVDCTPLWRVAVVIPFRNRHQHLWIFLDNMIRFLKMQGIQFCIFVIDQKGPQLFNRAALMNIGFLEASKYAEFDCFVFHDVDLIPEDLANIYACADKPRHLAVTRSVTNYRPAVRKYYEYFGGAVMMTGNQIKKIHGFSNKLFSWGGEDDEILGRLQAVDMKVLRYHDTVGCYISLPHSVNEEGNPHVTNRTHNMMYKSAQHNMQEDGYSTIKYWVLEVQRTAVYTHISVQMPGPTNMTQLQDLNAFKTIRKTKAKSKA